MTALCAQPRLGRTGGLFRKIARNFMEIFQEMRAGTRRRGGVGGPG